MELLTIVLIGLSSIITVCVGGILATQLDKQHKEVMLKLDEMDKNPSWTN